MSVEEMSLESEAHDACARLRFSEGLRRRWREARAEAAVTEAANLSFLEGGRVPVEELRALATSELGAMDPRTAYALGIWRAAWNLAEGLPPLNARGPRAATHAKTPASVIASIHRDICSYLVAQGELDQRFVAIPQNPVAMAQLMRVHAQSETPALQRCARMWQIIVENTMFEVASTPVAVLFSKWFLAETGVEPTAVSVLSKWASSNRNEYFLLAGSSASETFSAEEDEARTLRWRQIVSQSVLEGCEAGQGISSAILSGTYPR